MVGRRMKRPNSGERGIALARYKTVSLRSALMCVLMLLPGMSLFATTKGPDATGYTATDQAVYSFVDISATGASILRGIDDGDVSLVLPFTFQFYGQSYTSICVSANGALYFVGSTTCAVIHDFANTDLTVAPPPNDPPALLPFWSDLSFQVPGSGSVFYQTLGTVGNRRFVVEWNNAYPQLSHGPITFEVVLYETTNRILFQYQNVTLDSGDVNSNAGRATVGIHNTGGLSSGQQLAWSYDASVIANSTALEFSAPLACEQVQSTSISSTRSGFSYNFGTRRFVQTVKLTNVSNAAIAGPINLVLDNLSGNATLFQPAGTTRCAVPLGSPFATAPGPLAPGATLSFSLQFVNPTKATITYTPRVLAGSGVP